MIMLVCLASDSLCQVLVAAKLKELLVAWTTVSLTSGAGTVVHLTLGRAYRHFPWVDCFFGAALDGFPQTSGVPDRRKDGASARWIRRFAGWSLRLLSAAASDKSSQI